MAESFFLAAASNAVGTMMVDYLVKPIERRLRYLFRFHKIVQELHEQQKNLNREQTRVQEDVKEAKLNIQTKEIDKYVENWLTDAANALNEIQSLEQRIEENKTCFRWCPNWSWRYRLSKSIDEEIRAITELINNSKFERIGHRAELPALEFITSKGLVTSRSSTAAFNKIMEALKEDEIKIIGVWGMGGVGKTTLVKEVGNKVEGFGQPIMAVVSRIPDILEIQNKIADGINLKFEKTTKDDRAKELWSRLKDGKFLIILDDLWNEWNDDDDLRKIGIPLIESDKGCKIILTTRRRTVCESMNCQVTVPVDVLEADEAWALFKVKADLDERVSRDIMEEAEKVAEECKGLPVAIVTLARALKGTKTRKGWELARKKLESSRLMDIGSGEEEDKSAYMCIRMSYEHLKKETTRACFLMCALYPEDHSIDVEELVRYAWALELYGKADSVEEVRIQVLEAIAYLNDSCLLLEDEDEDEDEDGDEFANIGRYVKMHDIVRDVALWITSEEESGFTIKSRWELLDESVEHCKAISLLNHQEKKFPEGLVLRKLEILLLENCDVQGTCFQGMRELKVLSLTFSDDSTRLISLYALKSLRKLRALHLENFEDLSFLGTLRTLEVLSLRGSGLEGLADELGRLENLKILDLTDCEFSSRFPIDGIQRLSKLQELYLKGSNIQEVVSDILGEINSFSGLTALSLDISLSHFTKDFEFPKLERYDISISARDESYSIHLTEKSWRVKGIFPLNVVSLLPENLEYLAVSGNIDEFVECLTDKSLKLSNLKLLNLNDLSKLSCIWELPTRPVRLECLVHLRMVNCHVVNSLFPLSLAQSLVLLETLLISECHGLKQVIAELEVDEEEISSTTGVPNSLCFPNLGALSITNCEGLEFIFPKFMAPELQSFISLQYIEVLGCPKLTDLVHLKFPNKAYLKGIQSSALEETSCIRDLEISTIENHPNLVPDAFGDGLNGLDCLQIWECKDLECLVDTTTGNGPTDPAFTNLEKLSVNKMDGFKNLCKGQPPQGFLNKLKRLTVQSCTDLQVVFQMDEVREENREQPLLNLQYVNLQGLSSLIWILGGSANSFSLQSLQTVEIFNCVNLKSLFSRSTAQSLELLEELKVYGCHSLKTLFAEPEYVGEIESNSCSSSTPFRLPKLKTVWIHSCWELECFLPITLAQGLPALESVSLNQCDKLEQVFSVTKEQDGVENDGIVSLARLWYLCLDTLRKLTSFVPKNYIVKAPALVHLEATYCPALINFPIRQVNKELKLELQEVDPSALKELISNAEDVKLGLIKHPGNLVPDVDIEHLDRLTSLDISQWYNSECLVGLKCNNSQPHQGSLRNLKNLRVRYCQDLVEVFRIDEGEYLAPPVPQQLLPSLECLELEHLFSLTWVIKGPPTHCVNLKTLKVFTIINCFNLRYLFSVSVVQNLSSLEELKINGCPQLKSVFMELESGDGGIEESDTLCLPNLKTVEILECWSLEYVFPLALARGFRRLQKLQLLRLYNLRGFVAGTNILEAQALEILDIRDCPAFRRFTFTKQVNKSVPLKELTIEGTNGGDVESCNIVNQTSGNLEYVTAGNSGQVLQLQGGYFISSLEKITLQHLVRVRDIWKGPIHVATNLRELQVHNCNSLTYIFPLNLIPRLPQLTILKIISCENLKQIISDDDSSVSSSSSSSQGPQLEMKMVSFSQLKQVLLENLPRLESFSPVGYHLEFPCLDLLDIKQYFKMTTIFTVNYLSLTVRGKTDKASQDADVGPSDKVIFWKRRRPTLLPPYVDEAEEISPLE